MSNRRANLFTDAAAPDQGELFSELLRCQNVTIERIVSTESDEPVRYEQAQDEWVALLQGHARMDVDGEVVDLARGDTLFLPAGVPHTVLSTSQGTLWLAVHIHGGETR